MNNLPEIEKQFESLPKTWGDHMQSIKNKKLFGRSNLCSNEYPTLLIARASVSIVDNVTGAIQTVAPVFYWLVGVIGETINTAVWAFNTLSNSLLDNTRLSCIQQ